VLFQILNTAQDPIPSYFASITVSDMEGYDSERDSLQNKSSDASPEFVR
jgi:hypothetical protein